MDQNQVNKSRRTFLKNMVAGGIGVTLAGWWGKDLFGISLDEISPVPKPAPLPPTTDRGVTLSWLDQRPPLAPIGVSWGVPWPKGAMTPEKTVVVRDYSGKTLPTQTWPLAYWPDGSIKWTGLSIAGDPSLAGPLSADAGQPVAPSAPIRVREESGYIEIETGPLRCRLARRGNSLIESLTLEGRKVGTDGRLVLLREDRSEYASKRTVREEEFRGKITSIAVEQAGPVRAVVHVKGNHAGMTTSREWLPFSIRFYFTAGTTAIRIVHSFVFDGESREDYIKGLGIAFTVPFREELQNRHVRFSGEGEGVWLDPVMMSPSYRDGMVKDALAMRTAQLEGRRIPDLDDLGAETKAQFETVAVWDEYKLSQLSCDSFTIRKRTGDHSAWIQGHHGNRARGMAFLGDVSGGLAVGVKKFWEKCPAALEITGATKENGELKVWFWAPDAPAMDMRHYDIIGHDGRITYEDYEPGFSTPEGVANTNELTLWVLDHTPDARGASNIGITSDETPLLICTPEYYHAAHVFGVWSLPDTSTREKREWEGQLDRAWNFFHNEIEQRRWYGFWDYGDFVRTYDKGRHQWMYDIGGHAWNNTELMPDTWMWLTFLRTGRADAFRFAETLTRHGSEVDVHHTGRFAGLGTRHNVIHWGCSAKEARISEAFLKRHYYYLTTDDRVGDLMREVLTVDETIGRIQPLRKATPRPDVPYVLRSGPDWIALAGNWFVEWERTGNTQYRDYILAGMQSLGAMPEAFRLRSSMGYDIKTKKLYDIGDPAYRGGEFIILFGGDEIANELMQSIDCPEFEKAWNDIMAAWVPDPRNAGYTRPRVAGYLARTHQDSEMAAHARELIRGIMVQNGQKRVPDAFPVIDGPEVARPFVEYGNATPDVAQWAINYIVTSEYIRPWD